MSENRAKLLVQVQPNAKSDEIVSFEGGTLRVKICAPPVKGKANKALIELLSSALGVRKSNIIITKGETNKRKTVMVEGLPQTQIMQKLNKL